MKVLQWVFQYQQILSICPNDIQQGLGVSLFSQDRLCKDVYAFIVVSNKHHILYFFSTLYTFIYSVLSETY